MMVLRIIVMSIIGLTIIGMVATIGLWIKEELHG